MFDWVRSSYDLGEEFTNRTLQTKDIEKGFGGSMAQYWISPNGYLYLIDYSRTADFVEVKEGEPGYDPVRGFLNFKWVPNGTHGKVTPIDITDYVEVYPDRWEGTWEDWPRCRIHFRRGLIQDFESMTRATLGTG